MGANTSTPERKATRLRAKLSTIHGVDDLLFHKAFGWEFSAGEALTKACFVTDVVKLHHAGFAVTPEAALPFAKHPERSRPAP